MNTCVTRGYTDPVRYSARAATRPADSTATVVPRARWGNLKMPRRKPSGPFVHIALPEPSSPSTSIERQIQLTQELAAANRALKAKNPSIQQRYLETLAQGVRENGALINKYAGEEELEALRDASDNAQSGEEYRLILDRLRICQFADKQPEAKEEIRRRVAIHARRVLVTRALRRALTAIGLPQQLFTVDQTGTAVTGTYDATDEMIGLDTVERLGRLRSVLWDNLENTVTRQLTVVFTPFRS